MKKLLLIAFLVFGSGFLMAQTAVGIRIGNGSSGFDSRVTNSTSNRVEVESQDEKMVAYVVFDENENVIKSKEINESFNTSVEVENLQPGVYYIAVVSENDEVSVNVFVKP